MLALQETMGLPPADTFSSFHAYLDAAEELFIESMQDAADNEWHEIRSRMEGATEREICAEMERWWDGQIRRFRTRLWMKRHREGTNRLKRALRRETVRRIHAEEQQAASEMNLFRTEGELAMIRALLDHLEEEWRCKDCKSRFRN